jgi:probable F420-dependent oxidoreductase
VKLGAILRLGPLAPDQPPAAYPAIRDMAQRVEAAGLDSIWVYDHLLYRWPGRSTDGIWEAWTVLSALAEATRRVELGTLVLCSPFRNPALVAKMACTLDEVSSGRFTLGLGAGWHQPEFDAFGVPFDHRVSRFHEALRIIRPLLRDGQVDFEGAYYAVRDCEIAPRGPRPDGPPLLVAGGGPRMVRLAAEFADAWNTAWHTSAASVAQPLAELQAACQRSGRQVAATACVTVAYPDLGPPSGPGSGYLSGPPEHLAAALADFAQLGLAQLMIDVSPHSPAALGRLAEAVDLCRRQGPLRPPGPPA